MRQTMTMLSCCLGLFACGSDSEQPTNGWPLDDPNGADAATHACSTDSDCGPDEYCREPAACEAARRCEPGYPPISAAPPELACGCEGTVISVNAGYPGRHGWILGRLGDSRSLGESCDPAARPPFEYSVEMQIELAELEEHSVIVGVGGGVVSDTRPAPLSSDGVFAFEGRGDQYVSFQAEVLVDVDADGACAPGDTTYLATASEPDVDLHTFDVRGGQVSLGGAGEEDPCLWSPVDP